MSGKTAKNKMKTPRSMLAVTAARKNPICDIDAFRTGLLAWYDRHRRTLPWRASSPETANPYHVWLSEIMLQQTVVAAVIPYFVKFVDKWPTVHDLANANQEEVMQAWAGLGYYARARNLHKCAQLVSSEMNGAFPAGQDALKKLPGIGDYTSAAVAAIAFDLPATVVDGNVERVISRYFAITEPLPDSKPVIKRHAALLSEGRTDRPGCFAQAMMDLGATICTPQSPKCALCPLHTDCEGYRTGIQQTLPRKKAKAKKPHRTGKVYWLRNSAGDILVERRPEQGLLGGMTGLPTSEWREGATDEMTHPSYLVNTELSSHKSWQIRHVFTHFTLQLDGYTGSLPDAIASENKNIFWVKEHDILTCGLPTVFKKFVKLMLHSECGAAR